VASVKPLSSRGPFYFLWVVSAVSGLFWTRLDYPKTFLSRGHGTNSQISSCFVGEVGRSDIKKEIAATVIVVNARIGSLCPISVGELI
jgi:hypothetical protein